LVFISHASVEKDRAATVAGLLNTAGVVTLMDTADLRPGYSFVNFMENALCRADYCLLLWSRRAAQQHYVAMEWEAAFVREQEHRRVFLVVGRLEDHPAPALLRPRLNVDLFPRPEPGVDRLVELWRKDTRTAAELGHPVLPPLQPQAAETRPSEVYVSSRLFDCVLPVPVDLDAPAGLVIEETRTRLGLPRRLAVNDMVGLDLRYRVLRANEQPLDRTRSLREQGVAERAVLALEVTVEEFAVVAPVAGPAPRPRTYRQSGPADRYPVLLDAFARLGLRSPGSPNEEAIRS
jgi:hypothetical protein